MSSSKTTRGERIAVDVGDLAVGEERHILIKLAPGDARQWDLVTPELTYRKATTSSDALLAHHSATFRQIGRAHV